MVRILVLDDEDIIRMVVSSWLKGAGYLVETASNGQQAVDIYKQALNAGDPFDLLILDLTIPGGVGGAVVLKEIMAIDPDARAIISSGYFEDHMMSKPAFKSFRGMLAKPYTESQLYEVLGQVLK
ncbi:MAG: response regulator [bacterium]